VCACGRYSTCIHYCINALLIMSRVFVDAGGRLLVQKCRPSKTTCVLTVDTVGHCWALVCIHSSARTFTTSTGYCHSVNMVCLYHAAKLVTSVGFGCALLALDTAAQHVNTTAQRAAKLAGHSGTLEPRTQTSKHPCDQRLATHSNKTTRTSMQ
jgi:hypothetical protein